nr:transposase [Thiolapillus sp.]
MIGKAEYLPGKANPRFVVTNLSTRDADAQYLYEDLYCARGEMENRIKEQQLGLFADRTSSATLRANQLRLYFSSFAYVLLHGLRRLGLTGTAFAKAQSTTIRLKLLKIGARLRLTARKVWLSFSEAYPYASDIAQILANLKQHPAWLPPG